MAKLTYLEAKENIIDSYQTFVKLLKDENMKLYKSVTISLGYFSKSEEDACRAVFDQIETFCRDITISIENLVSTTFEKQDHSLPDEYSSLYLECQNIIKTEPSEIDNPVQSHEIDLSDSGSLCSSSDSVDPKENNHNSLRNRKTKATTPKKKVTESYPCLKCDETFPSKDQLREHTFVEHGGQIAYTENRVQYTCEACNISFPNRDFLRNHTRNYHGAGGAKKNSQKEGVAPLRVTLDGKLKKKQHPVNVKMHTVDGSERKSTGDIQKQNRHADIAKCIRVNDSSGKTTKDDKPNTPTAKTLSSLSDDDAPLRTDDRYDSHAIVDSSDDGSVITVEDLADIDFTTNDKRVNVDKSKNVTADAVITSPIQSRNVKSKETLSKSKVIEGYPCTKCDESFPSKDQLREHTFVEHKGQISYTENRVQYTCEACNISFPNRDFLRNHTRNYHGAGGAKKNSHKEGVARLRVTLDGKLKKKQFPVNVNKQTVDGSDRKSTGDKQKQNCPADIVKCIRVNDNSSTTTKADESNTSNVKTVSSLSEDNVSLETEKRYESPENINLSDDGIVITVEDLANIDFISMDNLVNICESETVTADAVVTNPIPAHNSKSNETLPKIKLIEGYPCSKCDEAFPSKDQLREHTFVEHKNKIASIVNPKYTCEACNIVFPNRDFLRTHARNYHGAGDSRNDSSGQNEGVAPPRTTLDGKLKKKQYPVAIVRSNDGGMQEDESSGVHDCHTAIVKCIRVDDYFQSTDSSQTQKATPTNEETVSPKPAPQLRSKRLNQSPNSAGPKPKKRLKMKSKECAIAEGSHLHRDKDCADTSNVTSQPSPSADKTTDSLLESNRVVSKRDSGLSAKTSDADSKPGFDSDTDEYSDTENPVHDDEMSTVTACLKNDTKDTPNAPPEDIANTGMVSVESEGVVNVKVQSVHGQSVGETKISVTESKRVYRKSWPCGMCEFIGDTRAQLWEHARSSHDRKPVPKADPFKICDICGESVPSRHLSTHINSHTKPFKCETCGIGFSTRQSLRQHTYRHTGDKPYNCEYCGCGYTSRTTLMNHINVQHKGTRYKCELCGSLFKGKSHLKHHVKRVHEKERPHVCDMCGKGFSTKSSLIGHQAEHTNEYEFKCDQCDAKFAVKRSLDRHVRLSHSTERHPCELCGKVFKGKEYLTRHIREVHEDAKKSSCTICGQEFRYPLHMREHMDRHAGTPRFQCGICQRKFYCSGNLSKHKKIHHK